MSSQLPTPAGPAPDADLRLEARPAGLSSPFPGPTPRLRRRLWVALTLLLLGLLTAGSWLWYELRTRGEWRSAEDALQRHDLAAAADHLDRYLAHRPGDAAAWFLAGRTARRRGRFADAERCLSRCQQLGGVTDATRLEWDLLRVQQGDLGEVDRRLRRTVGPDHPDAILVLEALARGYQTVGRLHEVVQACDLWISLQPEHPWPWLWRGGVYEVLGNFHQALSDYRRAVENAPDDREVRLALGELLLRGRRPGDAVGHFEHVRARNPDDADALLGLASCRIEQGRPGDALPLLERALAKEPASARALFLRGKAALEMRDAATAVQWLTRATRQAPDDAEALYQLILALRAEGQHAEADRLAPRLEALRRDLDRHSVLVRSIALEPDDARLRHEAGVLALRIGRADEGVRWLLSALRCRGDHRATHAALAEHFARVGDPRAETHRRLAQTP